MMRQKIVLGASIGNCVHVAGVCHFLQLAEDEGYSTVFLGPATSIDELFKSIEEIHPDIIGISYRLTPDNVRGLLDDVKRRAKLLDYSPIWDFGGTKPVADIAAEYGLFAFISDGFDDISDSIRFLRSGGNEGREEGNKDYGDTLVQRVENIYPYPIIRHHFGLPSLSETLQGIAEIAEAKVLDVISLGPDQNAQQFFFNPGAMNHDLDGTGGVPIRSEADFLSLKEASRCGNYPLLRCYSGTEDVLDYAEMLNKTIDNAWGAVPLSWYNELDGRGSRALEDSISDAQALFKWHAQNGIPLEINEPHHWGLRDAHDVIPVVMAFISAYNAKHFGVSTYIAQLMFNNPSGLSFSMDFAKMLAMKELVWTLADESFRIYCETRTGLPLLCPDPDIAKGQLAASTFMQMQLKPHIVHVVGYCEADHAATAPEVIESCKIAKGVIRHVMGENFSIEKDSHIRNRKDELLTEARFLLDYIRDEYSSVSDPLVDPHVLADIIKRGIIDAVHIVKKGEFRGTLKTGFMDGKCVALDPITNEMISESTRLKTL